MKRTIISLLLTLALVISAVLPVSAIADGAPAGYNELEFERINAFLELEDENGVKNGFKLTDEYVPGDPNRWGTYYDYIEEDEFDCFRWEERDGELHIIHICCSETEIIGELNVSGFEYLVSVDVNFTTIDGLVIGECPCLREVSCCNTPGIGDLDLKGAPELYGVWAWNCDLTGIDVTNCPDLELLYIDGNPGLTELDVTNCPKLDSLSCMDTPISSIDLSNCRVLCNVDLTGAYLTDLDVTDCEYLKGGHMTVEGEGTFCYCWFSWDQGFIVINSNEDNFLGWYDENGLITTEIGIDFDPEAEYTTLIARFGEASAVLGDADGNGNVDANDALAVLRFALGVSGSMNEGVNCDVDGNGSVDANDALYILRYALGAISSFPAQN